MGRHTYLPLLINAWSLKSITARGFNKYGTDNAGIFAYNASMTSKQYTIRSVPPKLDETLRQRARQSGKSLNEVSIEALSRGVGISAESTTYDDLDWFIGSGSVDQTAIEETQKWLDDLPNDLDSSS